MYAECPSLKFKFSLLTLKVLVKSQLSTVDRNITSILFTDRLTNTRIADPTFKKNQIGPSTNNPDPTLIKFTLSNYLNIKLKNKERLILHHNFEKQKVRYLVNLDAQSDPYPTSFHILIRIRSKQPEPDP